MDRTKNRRIVLVGLFVLIGIIFLLGGILMIGNIHETFKNKIKITALFDDVSGLQIGNNIWFSGVKIGIVDKLKFYGHSQVEVTMKIDINSKQYIRKDAMVKISTDGLIGNKILVIYGGSSRANEVNDNDTLGVEKTFSSDDMINLLQENNRNVFKITNDFKILSQNLVMGVGSLGKMLHDDALYTSLSRTANSLQISSNNAQALINNLNNFSDGFEKKGGFANDLVNDTMVFHSIRLSSIQLEQITTKANNLFTNLNEVSTNTNTPFGAIKYDSASGEHFKNTLRNLDLSSRKLNDDLEAVQHNIFLRGFFKRKARLNDK